jgi:hypothetical protein
LDPKRGRKEMMLVFNEIPNTQECVRLLEEMLENLPLEIEEKLEHELGPSKPSSRSTLTSVRVSLATAWRNS